MYLCVAGMFARVCGLALICLFCACLLHTHACIYASAHVCVCFVRASVCVYVCVYQSKFTYLAVIKPAKTHDTPFVSIV